MDEVKREVKVLVWYARDGMITGACVWMTTRHYSNGSVVVTYHDDRDLEG